uniref:NADH dehydrogenase subunit 4L n=1 Tax=Moniliformis sp. TaxID=3068474 RepID=A0AA96UWK5_9BILA|nr:NADH dehydrogenase subunit 4L [Moniliformis sp.]
MMCVLMMVLWWVCVLNSVMLFSWLVYMELMFVLIIYCLSMGLGVGDGVGFVVIVVIFVGVVSLVISLSLYVNLVRAGGEDYVGLKSI